MTITTEWPEAGRHGECAAGDVWYECRILDDEALAFTDNDGLWVTIYRKGVNNWQFRPLRTERERCVDAAMNAYSSWAIAVDVPDRSVRLIAERFYDCGLLRLPEGDDK